MQSFGVIYDTCFASGINYTGGLQIKISLLCSIYHLWFDKNVRLGEIAIIHYDRWNIWSWKSSSGNNLVGEVFVGGVFIGEVSVGGLSWGKLSGNFLRKHISMLVLLCAWWFTKGAVHWSFVMCLKPDNLRRFHWQISNVH